MLGMLRLSDTLRPLVDPGVMRSALARLLGEHLGVDRVGYSEALADGVITL